MNTIEATAILGATLLVLTVSLSALSAYSKVPGQNERAEETSRSREGIWLIVLNFLLILLILVWRVL